MDMKLLIAIPALNEEQSISQIIERCLEARDHILSSCPVTEVVVTVVSDGSTDRTVSLARRYSDRIRLIVFERNRGYGAAIKEAWRQSDADLLGFIDADGTCDPKFFAQLCQTLFEKNADIVLGARLNEGSRMPLLRRLGNRIFALILQLFSDQRVVDTASGMRVVRRSCLHRILPLPDGLHFTPAMSARALLSDGVSIAEVEMPYRERSGKSKLKVMRDGLRFLRVIGETTCLYRPFRLMSSAAAAFLFSGLVLMSVPTVYYWNTRTVADWMIYRFIVAELIACLACLFLCGGHVAQVVVSIALPFESGLQRLPWTARVFRSRWFWLLPLTFGACAVFLLSKAFLGYIHSGSVYAHWSRFIVASFCVFTGAAALVTRTVDYLLTLVHDRVRYLNGLRLSSLAGLSPAHHQHHDAEQEQYQPPPQVHIDPSGLVE